MTNSEINSLPQRSIYYFLATYPSFYPLHSSGATEKEQKEAYTFIKDIYIKLFRDPMLLGFKPLPDASFGNFEQQKDNPKLVTAIRKPIKKIEEFMTLLWSISLLGKVGGNTMILNKNEIDLTPANIRQLAAFDIQTSKVGADYIFTFPIGVNGLKLLAEISKMNVKPAKDGKQKPYLLFSRGVFNPLAPWSREVFGNMLNDRKPFDKLIDYLDINGYQRIDNKEYNNNVSLDYVKNYGNAKDEVKSAFAERTHSGIEILYEETRRNQFLLSLRIPYFKEVLQNTDKMNDKVKKFLTATSKKCDGCRYCVQTDKTGKRPLACISVESYKLCPLFPGFYFRWRTLEDETVVNIIEMLKFIDEMFAERRRVNNPAL